MLSGNITVLQNAGLTKNEAQVYVGLISSGTSGAAEIAKKSGVQRTLVYDALKRLVEKGLASEVDVNGKKMFTGVKPARLKLVVEEQQKAVMDGISSVMQELEKTYSETPKPAVRVYTGFEGIKTVMTEWLDNLPPGGTMKLYRLLPVVAYRFPVFLSWFNKKRVAKKILLKVIVSPTEQATKRAGELKKQGLVKVRYLKNPMNETFTYHIFGNKASIFTVTENEAVGMVIESKTIVKALEDNFDYVWKTLKRED
ncbi:MAG: helix-turn-helix domain-containing protein [Candidatus Micrarchaeota archaeon]